MTKKKTGVIYELVAPNGRDYIGQTVSTLKVRLNKHVFESRKGYNQRLYNSVRKYGWENFQKNILYDNIPVEFLDIMEIITIELRDTYHNGLNSTIGGQGGGSRGQIITEATKALISAKAKIHVPLGWKKRKRRPTITQHKRKKGIRYALKARFNNVEHCLGTYDTREECVDVYNKFADEKGIPH